MNGAASIASTTSTRCHPLRIIGASRPLTPVSPPSPGAGPKRTGIGHRTSAHHPVGAGVASGTGGQAPVALLHAEFAVRIVGGPWVARGVERTDFLGGEPQAGRTEIGLKLLGRAGTEDCRGHRRP